jgi:hypothetical protein
MIRDFHFGSPKVDISCYIIGFSDSQPQHCLQRRRHSDDRFSRIENLIPHITLLCRYRFDMDWNIFRHIVFMVALGYAPVNQT